MKISRQANPASQPAEEGSPLPWKVLIIDDDKDVHLVTTLSLRDFTFTGRGLEFLHAYSGAEARTVLAAQDDIAVALVDVVMESDDAGLKLVEYIRNELKNTHIRLIIRTGQPGAAPEKQVIDNYDIDDYKEKTELTVDKLYTTIRTTLKAYRDIRTIDNNRRGLEHILQATPHLYITQSRSFSDFFQGVLEQLVSMCQFAESGIISTVNGFVATLNQDWQIEARVGYFQPGEPGHDKAREVEDLCRKSVLSGQPAPELSERGQLIPLSYEGMVMGYIYVEHTRKSAECNCHLIQIMASQVAAAMRNLLLHHDLVESNDQALKMLAIASEFKDECTGDHIGRIQHYSTAIALELGMDADASKELGEASILHDIGKLGIPDQLLQKPGKLTPEEFIVIKKHSQIGSNILGQDRWFELARGIALHHHERWDGAGYPGGLIGENIPLAARIVAVVDVFDALTHKRPYKEAWSVADARAEIERSAGTQFDPAVVQAFLRLLDRGELRP